MGGRVSGMALGLLVPVSRALRGVVERGPRVVDQVRMDVLDTAPELAQFLVRAPAATAVERALCPYFVQVCERGPLRFHLREAARQRRRSLPPLDELRFGASNDGNLRVRVEVPTLGVWDAVRLALAGRA